MKCWCVTDSDSTLVLHLWGEAPQFCELCCLDLASTWYRWVHDGISEGLWGGKKKKYRFQTDQNITFLVFGVEPDLTREGGSIPVTLTFQEATGKNVMLLPVGAADDGAHSQNEKLNR